MRTNRLADDALFRLQGWFSACRLPKSARRTAHFRASDEICPARQKTGILTVELLGEALYRGQRPQHFLCAPGANSGIMGCSRLGLTAQPARAAALSILLYFVKLGSQASREALRLHETNVGGSQDHHGTASNAVTVRGQSVCHPLISLLDEALHINFRVQDEAYSNFQSPKVPTTALPEYLYDQETSICPFR